MDQGSGMDCAVEVAMSDSSTCRDDGASFKDDVLYSNFCDENQTPERTLMTSSRTQSETSRDNNFQMGEAQTPYTSEYTYTNTHIMSGDDSNLASHGDMNKFEGKNETYFPEWRLPSKIRRKFTAPNKDSGYPMQKTSKTADDVNGGDNGGVHSPKNGLRVCVDCNTTKTPLWRGGPQGPKSLCNACGIRYRKQRRALFASLNSDGAQSIPPKKRNNLFHAVKKQNKSSKSSTVGAGSNQFPLQVNKLLAFCHRHGLENGMYGNRSSSMPTPSKHSAIQRRFAQEEEEAAKLLMAISYGLAYA